MSEWIVDVDDASFEAEVITHSAEQPVVVDFWAEWCAPCRNLGPRLEALAEEYAGAFRLAKIDIEAAPGCSSRYSIRSIPAVLGFRDGEVISQFAGSQPDPAIREFLEAFVPSRADLIAKSAADLVSAGRIDEAEGRFREALVTEPRHPSASLGLAQLLFDSGKLDAANEVLDEARHGTPVDAELEHLAAALRTKMASSLDATSLADRVNEAPSDVEARLSLGRSLAASGEYREALENLLESIKSDPHYGDEAARKVMLDIFEVLGPEDDLTREYRGLLARTLYP